MKKVVSLLFFGLLFIGCDSDSGDGAGQYVVTDGENSIPFEEVLFLVSVKTPDNGYLVVKSIDSVNIYINGNYWAKPSSKSVDMSVINKQEVGNRYETSNKLNYLVIADRDIKNPDYSTAGDYAQYLNDYYELKPGEYACMIESFQVTLNDNTVKKYYPFEYRAFKIEENSKSAFLGEIELKID